ncbi:hypothetical protein [Klebsiella michiganensis]|uniref:hypothetical protein n=1 Tax=Klebsiella michiganensis TaxID=1134687 RepID=UPI002448F03D|nr:hypothetical protein [Klebsiella michiganensis]ELS0724857.1 hypothetical protein [Klebsiella michiganensis]MDH1034669.1 hypothetical protein [Klebsiella michiganensis]MDH1837344.1 hypothetical protein [Klebsiella michiganensis]MDH1873722.1 hypothetical protein [Klebsiella michiganensis]
MGQVVHAELARVTTSHLREFGLKKVVQGGTAVAEAVPLFRLAFFRWYSAKPRLARLYHLSHLYHLKNRRTENGEKGLKRQRLKGRENKGNGPALKGRKNHAKPSKKSYDV